MKKPEGSAIIRYAMTVAQNSWELRDVELSPLQIEMAYQKMLHAPQTWWDDIPEYEPLSKVAKRVLLAAKDHDDGIEQGVPV